ncbi:hypothetical protein HBI18_001890 [Parastagonospora nodorum]|nr:hypothetical protein HBI18_001890 [Parastagonospora nodorum]
MDTTNAIDGALDGQDLSVNHMNTKISSRNQKVSPLLHLPAELRNKIYEYVLSDYKIQVEYVDTSVKGCVAKNFLSLTTTCRQDLLIFLAGDVLDNTRLEAITKISIIFKFPGFYDPPEYHGAVKSQLRDLLQKLGGMPNISRVTIGCQMTAEEFEKRAGMRSGLLAHAQSVLGEQSGGKQIDVAVVCAL